MRGHRGALLLAGLVILVSASTGLPRLHTP